MCGVAGFLVQVNAERRKPDLEKMTRSLKHRGPDGTGHFYDGPIALGHTRLSIIDISDAGHQPMSDSSGRISVSYNGEIYNFQALRREIIDKCGYKFKSNCDTEVLPIGYLLWGEALFEKLEGMFAIALWDSEQQELALVRDGAGIKPLFIYNAPDGLFFASEIKAFQCLKQYEFALCPEDLHTFLGNGYVSPTRSLLRNVEQIAPGTIVRFDRQGSKLAEHRFWEPTRRGNVRSMDDACEQLGQTLRTVVSDMMVSDVPVGIMQSGGIDSSLISYSARGFDVPLFTATFDSQDFDESDDARTVSAANGFEHHFVKVQNDDSAEDVLRSVAMACDGQLADSSAFALFKLSGMIRRHVTVALSGEGGDEFFAGYPTYRASRLATAAKPFIPNWISAQVGKGFIDHTRRQDERVPLAEKLGRFMLGMSDPGPSHPQWRRYLFRHQMPALYGQAMQHLIELDPLGHYAQAVTTAKGHDPLDNWMLADQTYYLPSDMLAKSDRISMAHSLEVRVPFMDRRVMDLASDLHHSLMTSMRGPDKLVLRECLKRMGGPLSISGGGKRGFNVPIARLLADELYDTCHRIFGLEADRFSPWLNPSQIQKLWLAHHDGRQSHHYVLWTLLVLAIWMEESGV